MVLSNLFFRLPLKILKQLNERSNVTMKLIHPPKSFFEVSRKIGEDFSLTQAAGGNTSFKVNNTLWIKASGKWLKNSTDDNIFIPVDMKTGNLCPWFDGRGMRPSIETALHRVLPHKVIFHVHCLNTISLSIQKKARSLFSERLKGFDWAFVPYVKPGAELAKAIEKCFSTYEASVYVLENHGLVVCAETLTQADALLYAVVKAMKLPRRVPPLPEKMYELHGLNYDNWTTPKHNVCHAFAVDSILMEFLLGGAAYPDHVVYLGRSAKLYTSLKSFVRLNVSDFCECSAINEIAVIQGVGVLVKGSFGLASEEMLKCAAEVGLRLPSASDIKYLPDVELDKLLNWDAEKFRQSLNS